MFDLSGRVALVTGSSGGLGQAMALALAGAGAHVVVHGRDAGRVDGTVGMIRERGGSASGERCDVNDLDAIQAMIARIEAGLGRLDILISNVGERHRASARDIAAEDFNRMFGNHVTAGLILARTAAPIMRRNGYGRIILITSIAASFGRAGDVGYIAAKGAVSSMTRALACEFGVDGITCNAIAPGLFATEPNIPLVNDPKVKAGIVARTPLQRHGEPGEIGPAAVFLASPGASYVSGHVLTVDGGSTIHV